MNFFFYQNESELPEDIINGNCYFVSNSSSSKGFDIYLDDEGSRKIFDESIVGLTYNQFMEAIKDLIFSTININAPSNISVSPTAYVLNEQEKETNSFPVRALGNYTGYIVYGNQGKSASVTIEITESGQIKTLTPQASQLTIDSALAGPFVLQAPSGRQIETTYKSYVLDENGLWSISCNSSSVRVNITLGTNAAATLEEEEYVDIGFITDSHETTSGFSNMQSHNPIAIIHGGDYINYGAPSELNTQVRNFSNHISTIGNHDYTKDSSYSTYCSADEISSCFSGTEMGTAASRGYYYIDLTDQKIRIIVLNTQDRSATGSIDDPQHYHNISSAQVSFLSSALAGRDNQWRAIVISHAPLTPQNDRPGWYGGTVGSGLTSARNALSGLAVDESGSKMPVLIALSGHCHALGYKYYDGICHFTGYASNGGENKYGGLSGDNGTDGQGLSHWYLIRITKDNKVTVYDYNENNLFKTIEIDGTEESDDNSPFSCIAFEDGKLKYLDKDRTSWNQTNSNNPSNAVYSNCDTTRVTIKTTSSNSYTFVNGLIQGGTRRIGLTPPDESFPTYAAYFDTSGRYTGYSVYSSQTQTTAASTRQNDFFGVPTQTLSGALGG